MEFVCPICQNGLSTTGIRCSHCGNTFNRDEWPEEAWTSNGMTSELAFRYGGTVWKPKTDSFLIGRKVGTIDLQLDHPSVSAEHVQVSKEMGFWKVSQIGREFSWNGEKRESAILTPGGILTLGTCVLQVEISYYRDTEPKDVPVSLVSGQSLPLNQGNCIRIGSDPTLCEIVLSGIEPVHSMVYWQNSRNEWWLVDCATETGTQLNHEWIRNVQLCSGDVIRIGNIPIHFTNTALQVGNTNSDGLSLQIQNLSAAVGKVQILHDISFAVESGEFVGVLGPSGCGKSSLIQRIMGLGEITAGEVRVNGTSMSQVRKSFLGKTAYLPQQVSLHENLTLQQECECFCQLHAHQYKEKIQSIPETLKLVGLEKDSEKQVRRMSGGQKRRAGIALELLRSPKLFLLDEPTSGLDPATESDVMRYLRRIANQGKTVVCSTHMMENFEMFDKILLLSRGRVVFYGKPTELLRYFGAERPLQVFQMLGEGSAQEQTETAIEYALKFQNSPYFQHMMKNTSSTLFLPVEQPEVVPISQEVQGYLTRYFRDFFSFLNSPKPWIDFCFSTLFIWFILQPLLISQAIKLSCAQKFYDTIGARQVFFFCLLSLFWLGMNNSVRELVTERIPKRCLERLRLASFTGYISSKILWTLGLCFAQTLLFAIFFFIPFHYPVNNLQGADTLDAISWCSLGIIATLFFSCLMGTLIALAVSALSSNENAAVGILPLILIPVLLFSDPVINNSDTFTKYLSEETTGKYVTAAVYAEWLSPCHQPLVLLDALSQKEPQDEYITKSLHSMYVNTALWLLAAFVIIIVFQNYRERSWEGR